MRFTNSFYLSAPLQKVVEVITSKAYSIAEGDMREDVVKTEYKLITKNDDRIEYDVHYTEYKRTKLGKIDKSGTQPGTAKNVYTASNKTLRWDYHNKDSKRFTLYGVFRFTPQGEGTSVVYDVEADVRLPLIGKKISKIIIKEFGQEFPKTQRLMEKMVGA